MDGSSFPNDEELMADVASGELHRMSPLFDRYRTALFQFFRRQGAEAAVSEDLVQEVFFRILRARQTYRRDLPFRAWLYQIARNVRVDHLRRTVRETQPDDDFGEVACLAATPEQQAEASESSRLLRHALDALPERKRELLILSRFQGLKYKEIAAITGADVNTVKVRIHRCMNDLRESFLALSERRAP